jgi:hypothetical protein
VDNRHVEVDIEIAEIDLIEWSTPEAVERGRACLHLGGTDGAQRQCQQKRVDTASVLHSLSRDSY